MRKPFDTYMKIANVFKFDAQYKNIVGYNDICEALKNIEWVATEKIDGTNIRIYWDGYSIHFGGRTNKSEIPQHLMQYLIDTTADMEVLFEQNFGEKEVCLYCEGYGYKIQADGEKYVENGKDVGFILFDVNVNGVDLSREQVNKVAAELGLKSVPIVCRGKLDEIVDYVKANPKSTLGSHTHEMEGVVLQPSIMLYDSNHNMLKFKCKYANLK